MGSNISLTAADGHRFDAYKSGPADARAGIVVIQEIFGVNHHIRAMADRLAAEGFLAIAPALFDRAERGQELGYSGDDIAAGRALRGKVPDAGAMLDVEAAAAALGGIPAGIVGYCYGGTIAWWGATRTQSFKAASGWYGGGVAGTASEAPNCPVQLHFGEKDTGIPMADVEKVRAANQASKYTSTRVPSMALAAMNARASAPPMPHLPSPAPSRSSANCWFSPGKPAMRR